MKNESTWETISSQLNSQFVLTLVIVFLVFFLFRRMSRNAAAKQEESRNEWFVVGTNVVTTSGFLGTIVDIDGDAVTLSSPSGDETVWVKAAISRPMDIPLAPVSEEENSDQASEDEVEEQASEATAADSAGSPDAAETITPTDSNQK
ncbi:MAG: preprotein translocase subunit YajC [Actinomycetaceae bacterium]|nr:preprotein translocase subunit YajC [Actinomycetaceae bacterium]